MIKMNHFSTHTNSEVVFRFYSGSWKLQVYEIKIIFKKKKPTSKKLNSTNKIIITQNSNKMH